MTISNNGENGARPNREKKKYGAIFPRDVALFKTKSRGFVEFKTKSRDFVKI
jgi:hypothetical protein